MKKQDSRRKVKKRILNNNKQRQRIADIYAKFGYDKYQTRRSSIYKCSGLKND